MYCLKWSQLFFFFLVSTVYQSIAIQQLQKAAKPINVVKSMGEDKREIPIVIDKILGKIEKYVYATLFDFNWNVFYFIFFYFLVLIRMPLRL